MPVFKVMGIDRGRKMMIVAKTVEEIISSARTKLKLPESEEGYTVLLEEDGTEIPDTDTLEEFLKACPTTITLTILEKNVKWVPKPIESLSQSMIENILSAEIITEPTDEVQPLCLTQPSATDEVAGSSAGASVGTAVSTTAGSSAERSTGTSVELSTARPKPLPWDKFPKKMIEDCERRQPVQSFDRNSMVRVIAEYLVDDLRQPDRSSCTAVADKILKRYPESFRVKINDSLISDGKLKLVTQIYNRVNYYRSLKNDASKKLRPVEESDGTNKTKKKTFRSYKSIQVDEYGCVEYEPPMPLTESKKSQSEVKELLAELANAPRSGRDVVNIKNLLDQTFPSQRADINHRSGEIKDILLDWPLLMESEFQLHHAEILLGKPINDIWRGRLERNLVIHDLMKQQSISFQKTRKPIDNLHIEEINKTLLDSKETSENMENKSALVLAIFPLIVSHFKEDKSFLYKVITLEDFDDEQIQKVVINPSPVLLINGESLYDTSATCAVVIERKICCLTKDALEGILITFLGYYVFGLTYPKELSKTLEFIQRVLLDINPQSKVSKVKKGNKAKLSAYTPAVMTLYNKLKRYYDEP